jgi:hypothetical protein
LQEEAGGIEMKKTWTWLTILAAIVILLVAAEKVQAQENHWEAVVLGKSFHFGQAEPHYDYNQTNPGIGIEYRWTNGFFVGGMTYYDSFRKQAYAAYGGYQYTIPVTGNWSVFGAVRAGYLNGSGMNGPMAMPSVGVTYKRFSIETTFVPKVSHDTTNVIALFARWRF